MKDPFPRIQQPRLKHHIMQITRSLHLKPQRLVRCNRRTRTKGTTSTSNRPPVHRIVSRPTVPNPRAIVPGIDNDQHFLCQWERLFSFEVAAKRVVMMFDGCPRCRCRVHTIGCFFRVRRVQYRQPFEILHQCFQMLLVRTNAFCIVGSITRPNMGRPGTKPQ